MALKTRVWGAGKLLLIGGALLLTYVLFAAAAMRIALKTPEVAGPAFTGQSENDATAHLAHAGQKLRGEERQPPDPNTRPRATVGAERAGQDVPHWHRSGED